MLKLYFLVLLALSSSFSSAQDVETYHAIKLIFRRKGYGETIKRVEVKVGDKLFYSDPQGELSLSLPINFDGTITAERPGYVKLTLSGAELLSHDTLEVFLFPTLVDDEPIIIKGERQTHVSRKSVSGEESRRVAPGGDAAQVIKLLPGVVSQNFQPQVVIRGSGPNDSKYYLDKLEVPFVFHSIGNLSLAPQALLAEVQFDSGGFGTEFGDATGGVIVLKTTNRLPEKAKSEFVLNLPIYSGIYHERPLDAESFVAVSLRRSYLEPFIEVFLKQERRRSGEQGLTIAPHFGDAHVFYWRKNEGGYTKTSLLAAEDGLKAIVPFDGAASESGTASFRIDNRFVNIGVEHYRRMSSLWQVTATPQIYFFEVDNRFVDNKVRLDITRLRIPTEFVYRLSEDEDIKGGFDPSYAQTRADVYAILPNFEDPSFDFEEASKEKTVKTYKDYNLAAWLSRDKQIGSWKLTPGLRVFYDHAIDQSSYDPRLQAKWPLTQQHTVKFAVGQYSKAPEPPESSELGNPRLQYERSHHYVSSVLSQWAEAWSTEVSLFYKRGFDLVTSDPVEKYNNDASLRSRGFEIFIRRNLTKHFFGWLSYTFSRTESRKSDQQTYLLSPYDQTHVLHLASSYRFTYSWELGGRFQYHTGSPYTPVKRAVYHSNFDKYQPRGLQEYENSARLPAYNALSLYLTHDFLFNHWKLALKTGLESYWFRPQVLGVQQNYDYSKEEYQAMLPFIPFLELRGEL